jgi:type I restriction enzyme, S subunit
MAGNWEEARLGELCDFRAGAVFKPSLQGQTSGEFPFVKVSDMNLPANAVRIQDANNWVSAADLGELRAKPFPPGTVVFAKIGEALRQNRLRQVARETVVDNNMMGAVPRINRIDPRFFYYALSRFDFSDIAQGTALPYLTVASLSGLTLDLPPAAEQRAIAHILGTLDDKIELNRRMNETLEAMARALFNSWFVDFDPVRAKAEGRASQDGARSGQPGKPHTAASDLPWPEAEAGAGAEPDPARWQWPQHILDLFPARLVDSELGEIPEGWEVGPLDSVVVLQRGFDLPATERTSGAYPVLAASGPSGTHNEFMVRGPGVTTGRSGVLGKVFYVAEDFWPLNTSLWVKEFRHSRPAYAFHLLRGLDFALFNAGSAVPTLNRNHVHTLPTLLPPIGLIDAFERFATRCLARQRNSDQQSTTLATMRDALLPKLISGELRVAAAEKILENAV